MPAKYSLETIDSCLSCKLRARRVFCDLPAKPLHAFEGIKSTAVYSKGATLFLQGQSPRGIFVLCTGRVKLLASSDHGRPLVMRIAEAGEILGLSATLSGKPYEASAEVLDACQANFVGRQEFLKFLGEQGDACLRVALHLSNNYNSAFEQLRAFAHLHSARGRLAWLLLEWCARTGEQSEQGFRLQIPLTHEEIAQMIGTSRETVTRLFAQFRDRRIINRNGSVLLIRDKGTLEDLVGS